MKAYQKSVRRAISKSLGRFIAIIAIVALGVGFLTGLLAATPDMKKTIDSYYDNFNAADIFVKQLTLFTDDDISKVKEVEGVADAVGVLSRDKVISYKETNPAARIYSMDLTSPENLNNINRLDLISGRFPTAANECVVERSSPYLIEIAVGDDVIIDGNAVKVTGIVGNSWYFSKEREQTTVGNGRLGAIVYLNSASNLPEVLNNLTTVPNTLPAVLNNLTTAPNTLPAVPNNLTTAPSTAAVSELSTIPKIYTDIFITVEGAKQINAFSEKYEETVFKVTERIKAQMPGAFVLDRNANLGFVSFTMNVDKIAAVAVVFPAFFFLVAALVALTTMTRMVEEERTQIGSLRAQGYSKARILSKYLIYCLLAGLIGCTAGVLVGFQLLPAVIWNAFEFNFFLPSLAVHFNVLYAGLSSLAAMIAITAATFFACMKTLKEKPAALMLPRAPKAGKRIALERIPWVWNHLKFKHKATIRNLFRYKKHFFMTVIGIAGCTALLLTGFGLKDSVNNMTKKQYSDILHYDIIINAEAPVSSELDSFLSDEGKVSDWASFYSESGYIMSDEGREAVSAYSPNSDEDISRFITLKKRGSKNLLTFNADSVILTEKIAKTLKIRVGDEFVYENTGGEKQTFKLDGITENYLGSMIYLGSSKLDKTDNLIMVSSPLDVSAVDETMEMLLAIDGVTGAEFTTQNQKTYDMLVQSIGFIVIILIVAAGGLAVIVLYNLINININERSKELATLKVLGYKNSEVAGYIFREIFILTIVGVFVGFALGAVLLSFVINTAETTVMMFSRSMSPLSFLFSGLLTIGFSLLVDFIMYFKLKKINMIDSMKAND